MACRSLPSAPAGSAVPLVDEPQALQREQVIDHVDALREADDHACKAAGGDRGDARRRAPAAGGRRCRPPGRRTRTRSPTGSPPRWTSRSARAARSMSTLVSRAAREVSASIEISMPGPMIPPRYSPDARHDVVVDRGPEVDDHAGVAGRGRSRRPRSRAGRARARAGSRAGSACRSSCRGRRSAPRGPGSARTCGGTRTRAAAPRRRPPRRRSASNPMPRRREQVVDHDRELVAGRLRGRSRSASARPARSPSKAPTWVCVLPTSIVRSTAAIIRDERRRARPAGRAAAPPARPQRAPSGSAARARAPAAARARSGGCVTSGCGSTQALRVEHRVAHQQQVDVDRARPVARARRAGPARARSPCRRRAARAARGRSRPRTTALGSRAGRAPRPPARSRRPTTAPVDRDAVGARRAASTRRAQVRQPVADVRARAPGSAARQRLTSTETSSTGSGIGGSGLVARTTMPDAPKRSSSMSATAVQTRSSVR